VSLVVCDCSSVSGGTMPSAVPMALSLDVAPLMTRFLGAIVDAEEDFLRNFLGF